jgi:hypothetical protein
MFILSPLRGAAFLEPESGPAQVPVGGVEQTPCVAPLRPFLLQKEPDQRLAAHERVADGLDGDLDARLVLLRSFRIRV